MTEIKICGIKDAAALDATAEAGAEWFGLVFFPPSPRAIGLDDAAELVARHPNGPKPVGLFVDPTDAELHGTLERVPLAALQLHTTPGRAAAIQATFGLPVWHAIGIATAADLPTTAPGVTRLLLDHKAPPGASRPGGNAQPFDWSLLRTWTPPVPWALAGGLTPETVAAAIAQTHAPTVDVSSGVERARGIKDPALIRAFIQAARQASPPSP